MHVECAHSGGHAFFAGELFPKSAKLSVVRKLLIFASTATQNVKGKGTFLFSGNGHPLKNIFFTSYRSTLLRHALRFCITQSPLNNVNNDRRPLLLAELGLKPRSTADEILSEGVTLRCVLYSLQVRGSRLLRHLIPLSALTSNRLTFGRQAKMAVRVKNEGDKMGGDLEIATGALETEITLVNWQKQKTCAKCVYPKVAQDLARHSDINLTMSRYSHTVLEQRAEAVAKLPALRTGVAASVATGTAGLENLGDLSCRPACCSSTENRESQRTGTASITYESTPAGVAEWQTQWIQKPRTIYEEFSSAQRFHNVICTTHALYSHRFFSKLLRNLLSPRGFYAIHSSRD